MSRISDSREQLRGLAAGARGRTLWETHHEAAYESRRLTRHVQAALGRAGIDTWPLPGTETLALLWERLHPTASHAPDFQTLADACQVAGATIPEQARAVSVTGFLR